MPQFDLTTVAMCPTWDPGTCSGSAFELGDNAGWITWLNSLDFGDMIVDQIEGVQYELKEYFAGFGAWSDVEIAQWDLRTLAGQVVQGFSASYRQLFDHDVDEGVISTNPEQTEWYYCVGD